jgi:hypothetical protein
MKHTIVVGDIVSVFSPEDKCILADVKVLSTPQQTGEAWVLTGVDRLYYVQTYGTIVRGAS